MSDVAEILLAQVWNAQWLSRELRTVDGRSLRVVYRGVWSHGLGPDFRGAMLDFDGKLITGDVEIDTRASSWYEHGHARNDDFNTVLLHIVLHDDIDGEVRTPDGQIVPRVRLSDFLPQPLEMFRPNDGTRPLGAIGFDVCAPELAREQPGIIRTIWQESGDYRMNAKVAAFSGWLNVEPASQTLYRYLLDALGYSRNRDGMSQLADSVQYAQLDSRLWYAATGERFERAAGVLLGAAGFIPFSPADQSLSKLSARFTRSIEQSWMTLGIPWHPVVLAPSVWQMARLRPASHPLRRILAMATLVASAPDGLVAHCVDRLLAEKPHRVLRYWLTKNNPWLGTTHAHEILVNVIVPFGIAYGRESSRDDVADAAAQLWQDLPAGRGNSVTRQTITQICGDVLVKPKSARAEQGLIHISRTGCNSLRCFECPIAHASLRYQPLRTAHK